jgi:hypothetical protein
VDGEQHRTDGPAVERADGGKCWYVHGKELTEEEFGEWKKSQRRDGFEYIRSDGYDHLLSVLAGEGSSRSS